MEKNKDKKVKPTKATKGKTESPALKSRSGITQEKFDALQKKYEAEIAIAKTNFGRSLFALVVCFSGEDRNVSN